MKSFSKELFDNINASVNNYYDDNYDTIRFGKSEKLQHQLLFRIREFFLACFVYKKIPGLSDFRSLLNADILYYLLEDDGSRELLISLLSFRLLGHRRVKLPTNTANYHKFREKVRASADKENAEKICLNHHPYVLYKKNLHEIGYSIKMYCGRSGSMGTFLLKQYEYTKNNAETIKADKNDVVIDAGACYGDTPLYFASEVGIGGKVVSIEFVPSNISVLNTNLLLNPDLMGRINLVEKPLWNKDHVKFYICDKGPASKVSMKKDDTSDQTVETITIDSLTKDHYLERVDFIKMDIEGAEYPALQGAIGVIRKHKPKLAISIYHLIDDFHRIPLLINSLNLGYKFYLKHITIHKEETILFAEA